MPNSIKKSEFFKVHEYMTQSLKDKPLDPDDIRIAIYIDDEINSLCTEVFGVEVDWEHFSEPHRFTGAANRTPPIRFSKTVYSYFC